MDCLLKFRTMMITIEHHLYIQVVKKALLCIMFHLELPLKFWTVITWNLFQNKTNKICLPDFVFANNVICFTCSLHSINIQSVFEEVHSFFFLYFIFFSVRDFILFIHFITYLIKFSLYKQPFQETFKLFLRRGHSFFFLLLFSQDCIFKPHTTILYHFFPQNWNDFHSLYHSQNTTWNTTY